MPVRQTESQCQSDMLQIAKFLDRKYARRSLGDYPQISYPAFLIWGRNRRYVGVVIDDEVVTLDSRLATSFRIKLANVDTIGQRVDVFGADPPPFKQDYLRSYFSDNQDNPYGLWNMCLSVASGIKIDALTQLPPLFYRKTSEEQFASVDRLMQEALPADLLFSFDRSSGIHRLIRSVDKGMWAHVAMISNRNTICESTTSGISESDPTSMHDANFDVGLYRMLAVDGETRAKITEELQAKVGSQGYGWSTLLRCDVGSDCLSNADLMMSRQMN